MGKALINIIIVLVLTMSSYAQKTDSVLILKETVVSGLETKTSLFKTPAAVHILSKEDITKLYTFTPATIFNTVAGVRMEERSPGSYRLAIRGSSIRSPFGVRNVKLYWNGIPFSDANGISYFNLLDMQSMGSIEILRGPAASMYGSGYGGVVNIKASNAEKGKTLSHSIQVGTFGTTQTSTSFAAASARSNTYLSYAALRSDGYRDHTELSRQVLNVKQEFFRNKHQMSIFGLLANLNYETPGGLTLDQKTKNAKAARATVADQKAGIIQKTGLFGVSDKYQINANWTFENALFLSKTALENPFLTNYEKRNELSVGLRSALSREFKTVKIWLGTEIQKTNSQFKVFTNASGKPTVARYVDDVISKNAFVFSQIKWQLPSDFSLEGGLSLNTQKYDINREGILASVKPYAFVNKPKMPLTSRIGLSKVFFEKLHAYARVSSGLSAPIASEIVSTLQNAPLSGTLSAEKALSREIGLKYQSKSNKIELIGFVQTIKNGLRRNLTATDTEFFTNVAAINQKGLEMSYLQKFKLAKTAHELTFNVITYDFKANKKALAGVAQKNIIIVHNINFSQNLSLISDYNYLSKMPLLDDNSIYSKSQSLLNSRLIVQKNHEHLSIKIKAGIDNILKSDYSAAYDFNAVSGRYYNPAPGRNFNGGISLAYLLP